jgi:putative ABC transport system permease protein
VPDIVRRYIGLVSRLAPSWARREFRAEWEAELETAWRDVGAVTGWQQRRHLAARAWGAVPDAWSLFRQQWSLELMLQDVRYGVRLLRQRLGFTAIVIATLAVGIGANAAMFTVIEGVLLRQLPLRDPSRLMMIWENDRLNGKPRYLVAPANFVDWQSQSQAFEQMAAYLGQSGTFTVDGQAVRVPDLVVTTNYFDVLGVRPLRGETFSPKHGIFHDRRQRVLVLSYEAWQRYFGGDPNIVGRDIDAGWGPGSLFHVLGVMPRGLAQPAGPVAFWRPAAFSPDLFANRALHFFNVIGRLRPGITPEQAQADMDRVAVNQQRLFPKTNEKRGVTLVPLREQIVGDVRNPLYVLGAAVFMVLLITCANIANLMLVRSASRRRELAVRAALGADRLRIVRQIVIEGLVLSTIGGLGGLGIAIWTTSVLSKVAAPYVPRVADIRVDVPVLLFLASASIVSGLLFAAFPAFTSSRTDVRDALQDGTRSTTAGLAARQFRSGLVVAELAIACVLVIGAALLLKSFWRVMQVSPGFAVDNILTADIELPQLRYEDSPQILQFYRTMAERVRALPGVQAVGFMNSLPMSRQGPTTWLTLERGPRPEGEPPEVNYRVAGPDLFRALDVPVLAGRAITDEDTPTSLITAVVNHALVQRFFPDSSPLGARVRIGPNPKAAWRTIVGVVGDMHQNGPEAPPVPEIYLPLAQDTFADLSLVARTAGDPLALAASVRGIVTSMDPELPVIEMTTMERIAGERLASRRLLMLLLVVFACMALGLALIGIYGVMAYVVSQRTPELGVRIALGAGRGEILRMVLGEGLRLSAVGLVVGLLAAAVITRLMTSLLFTVDPTDPWAFAGTAVAMLVVGAAACYLPARRAASVDPLQAIRTNP